MTCYADWATLSNHIRKRAAANTSCPLAPVHLDMSRRKPTLPQQLLSVFHSVVSRVFESIDGGDSRRVFRELTRVIIVITLT